MSTKEVLAIAIKLFSIWVMVQTFWLSSSFVAALTAIEQWQGSIIPNWAYIVMVGVFIVMGIILAYVLYRTADSVLRDLSGDGSSKLEGQAQKFLLQLGGIYFLVSALVYFPASISFMWMIQVSGEGYPFHFFLRPMGLLFQLIIGVWLLFHPSWWVLFLNRIRGRV